MIHQKAVFLDRDGVLIKDIDLLTRIDQVYINMGVPEALTILKASGYLLFVVTNQTVIARGLVTEQDVEYINEYIDRILFKESGCSIERFYYCPHHPEANLPQYRIQCECRKPRQGMLLKAAEEYNLDLNACFMIGDRFSDIIAGHNAGCKTILVKTGMHHAKPIVSDSMDFTIKPDHVCNDLYEASQIISEDK